METFFQIYWRELALCIVAFVLFLIQFFYYIYYNAGLLFQLRREKKGRINYAQEETPLSVIVYSEEYLEELQKTLPAVLSQEYSNFEVIVVNDGKNEAVYDYVSLLQNEYPRLYHTYVPQNAKYVSRKKLALTIGVKAACNEWVVVINSGCVPASPLWLKKMSRNFVPGTEIVLGYSNFASQAGLFSRFTAFDGMMDALHYLGSALHHVPYKGDGSNMAYRKKLFFQQRGFQKHLDLKYGEDDLFINSAATSSNTRVECSSESVVKRAAVNFNLWKNYKHKYAASSAFYPAKVHAVLLLRNASLYLFYFFIVILLLIGGTTHLGFAAFASFLFLLRYVLQQILIQKVNNVADERSCYNTSILFELLMPLFSLYFFLCRSRLDYTWSI